MNAQHGYATAITAGLHTWLRRGTTRVGVLLVLVMVSIGAIGQGQALANTPVAGRPLSAGAERFAAFKQRQAEQVMDRATPLVLPATELSAAERFAAFKQRQAEQVMDR
ncbi:MAG: hypothetical protein H7Y32_17380 [Chloroflexales bacterium]|nr:hypothetical protein [Chloroflexales bacterium]